MTSILPPSSSDMEYYYQYMYPFKSIFQWLSHSFIESQPDIANREFAMAFRSGAYKRYNSYNTIADFKNGIIKGNPDRFEIGAVYSKPPAKKDAILKTDLIPLQKELVFDIDMDDYDDYRTCCSGAQVCEKCWKFITLAIRIINVALVEDFGFKDIFWIFSGRRGAHCWCSDRRARKLTDLQRRNILDYLNIIRDRHVEKKLSLMRPLYPHMQRSLEFLKPFFVDIILKEQNPWEDDKAAIECLLLGGIYDKNLIELCKKFWLDNPGRSSEQKWTDIDYLATNKLAYGKKPDFLEKLRQCKEDLILKTLYPKLDIEVTKQTIHLLKAPFCIHPSTGNVCVPIMVMPNDTDEDDNQSYQSVEIDFDPTKAPKLISLQKQMEENGNRLENTDLQPYLEKFGRFVQKFIQNEMHEDATTNGDKKRFRENDW
ncbi:DNA primase subunit PRI1 SCDLUD_005193 [Saccharomycodes ludwigii]|uniref:DNA primase subunit PRI1 n=1 Tax=Saccharomycodes ludwigii TaxID=36035 RepID=UPI001E8BE8A3|nr:hypothetical protein SCDLUD_005193 [Saccharomycodes ludwigii]KAH3898854.1 hypothetical protein SCDLUD_005193 [Saccharomycodes ludwigii]